MGLGFTLSPSLFALSHSFIPKFSLAGHLFSDINITSVCVCVFLDSEAKEKHGYYFSGEVLRLPQAKHPIKPFGPQVSFH